MRAIRVVPLALGLAAVAAGTGCHRGESHVELKSRTISIVDRFYDVQALDENKVFVAGYGGKLLITTDGGFTWTKGQTGTDRALYDVHFVDANNGWAVGQEGLIIHSADGGKTWSRQESGTTMQLFALTFVSPTEGWAVGDRSLIVHTTDGGAHWEVRKVDTQKDMTAEEQIASQDPVLYAVDFVSPQRGWIVGEFGKILRTTDGGNTWVGQEQSLLGGEDAMNALTLPTFYGVFFKNETEGVASGLDGKLARTHDGGETWSFEKLKVAYPVIDPLYTAVILPDGSGWAVGAAGEVMRLGAEGQAWERAKIGMEVVTWLRGMDWLNESNGWIVGGYGLILHTKDGGKTWVPSLG